MKSQYLDAGYTPLYEFGYGLSYARFEYSAITVTPRRAHPGESITVRAVVRNAGTVAADEVAQLYVRDLIGSVTRPVRELKGFQRLRLEAGERREVVFTLRDDDLAFYGSNMRRATEPGMFQAWIGGSSATDLGGEFEILAD